MGFHSPQCLQHKSYLQAISGCMHIFGFESILVKPIEGSYHAICPICYLRVVLLHCRTCKSSIFCCCLPCNVSASTNFPIYVTHLNKSHPGGRKVKDLRLNRKTEAETERERESNSHGAQHHSLACGKPLP